MTTEDFVALVKVSLKLGAAALAFGLSVGILACALFLVWDKIWRPE